MPQTRVIHGISGPRNISTALMYSFAQRPGCAVIDEPFYGPYLQRTGLEHPGREQILAQIPNSVEASLERIQRHCEQGYAELYLKNMAHHMVGMPWDWAYDAAHIFWIRHPRKVIRSFAKVWPHVGIADIGIEEQVEQWKLLGDFPGPKIIVDSDEMLNNPNLTFLKICAALELPHIEGMFQWEKGPKRYDGPWSPHWYAKVHESSGFGPPNNLGDPLTERFSDLEEEALPFFEKLWNLRLSFQTN